jgi:hypothetical protein
MDSTMAKRSARPSTHESRARYVALALCNAERQHNMLPEISSWYDLTDEAQDHYMRLSLAALKAMGI